MNAQQGHRYSLGATDVLALSSGPRPRVARIIPDQFWPLSHPFNVDAEDLKPLPMVYFHGQTPS